MHEPSFVCGVERVPDLCDERERAVGGKRALRSQKRLQVGAGDIAHSDVEQAFELARFVDGHDIRMIERRCELRLTQEPLAEPFVLRELRRKELQRDVALQALIVGAVDHAHPTASEYTLELAGYRIEGV